MLTRCCFSIRKTRLLSFLLPTEQVRILTMHSASAVYVKRYRSQYYLYFSDSTVLRACGRHYNRSLACCTRLPPTWVIVITLLPVPIQSPLWVPSLFQPYVRPTRHFLKFPLKITKIEKNRIPSIKWKNKSGEKGNY